MPGTRQFWNDWKIWVRNFPLQNLTQRLVLSNLTQKLIFCCLLPVFLCQVRDRKRRICYSRRCWIFKGVIEDGLTFSRVSSWMWTTTEKWNWYIVTYIKKNWSRILYNYDRGQVSISYRYLFKILKINRFL